MVLGAFDSLCILPVPSHAHQVLLCARSVLFQSCQVHHVRSCWCLPRICCPVWSMVPLAIEDCQRSFLQYTASEVGVVPKRLVCQSSQTLVHWVSFPSGWLFQGSQPLVHWALFPSGWLVQGSQPCVSPHFVLSRLVSPAWCLPPCILLCSSQIHSHFHSVMSIMPAPLSHCRLRGSPKALHVGHVWGI